VNTCQVCGAPCSARATTCSASCRKRRQRGGISIARAVYVTPPGESVTLSALESEFSRLYDVWHALAVRIYEFKARSATSTAEGCR